MTRDEMEIAKKLFSILMSGGDRVQLRAFGDELQLVVSSSADTIRDELEEEDLKKLIEAFELAVEDGGHKVDALLTRKAKRLLAGDSSSVQSRQTSKPRIQISGPTSPIVASRNREPGGVFGKHCVCSNDTFQDCPYRSGPFKVGCSPPRLY